MPHEVLTVKYGKDRHFNYRWSGAGLFHNKAMVGLIHEAAITKLFGLRHLQWVKKKRGSGRADKKVTILTFSASTFYNKTR